MNAVPEKSAPGDPTVEAPDAVRLCLLLGQTLFTFGATARRIEDSVAWLARYLGCKVNMLVSYDAFLVTVDDGRSFQTRIDSSRRVAGLNLLGLAKVSSWLRGLKPPRSDSRDLEQALCAIRDSAPSHGAGLQALAAGFAGAAFCLVNGGDPVSCLGSFFVAEAVFLLRGLLTRGNFNIHLTFFTVAFAGSLLAALLARLSHTSTFAIALVTPVLFLVPGAPMINGGIDVIRNHVTLGIARVGYTLAVVVALSFGVGLTITLLSPRMSPPYSMSHSWELTLFALSGALAAGSLAFLNNSGPGLMGLCALGGLLGRLVRSLASLAGLDLIPACLVGVLFSTLVVGYIADRFRWPAVVASVMAALPMVPGYFAIAGLHSLLSYAESSSADPAQLSIGLHALMRAVFISLALVVGVIGPVTILQRDTERV
jgi:uncharacterized membrane protein YjjP (DUF1212 family)